MEHKPTILIVEDDPDQVLMYTIEFESRGFDVVASKGGIGATDLAREHMPDAVLLDIYMEDKDGLEILRELKEDDATRDIPVMVFTNFSKKKFEAKAKELGADAFVMKTDKVPREIVSDIQKLIGREEKSSISPSRNENILLIEDNPFHREMYTTKFAHAGFSLIVASNGEAGLERAKEGVDIILLDLALPGMSGVDVLKKLKLNESTRDIPVIALTATPKQDLPKEAREYVESHTVAYLEKITQLPGQAVEVVSRMLSKKT